MHLAEHHFFQPRPEKIKLLEAIEDVKPMLCRGPPSSGVNSRSWKLSRNSLVSPNLDRVRCRC
jgi:hypothetical protein